MVSFSLNEPREMVGLISEITVGPI